MDEAAYRDARGAINRLPCVFEKALLSGSVVCAQAGRLALAERESMVCTDAEAHANCRTFHGLLRENSLFALKLSDPAQRMTHALEMKLQCGGLRGLQASLEVSGAAPDVAALIGQALERYDGLAELPYSRIIQGVAAWQGRKRTGRDS